MPFFDLNVPWAPNTAELQRTLIFLDELGYNVVALNHTISGKLPSDLSCPIPEKLPFSPPPKLQILRRCTLILSDPSQNHRLSALASNYDILALRPVSEKSLLQASQSPDCDLVSLDLTTSFDFYFKMGTFVLAKERGIKFEICYGPGILSPDAIARRNLLSNSAQLIRAARSRDLILSSGASRAAGCRGPADVVNLAATWGLGQEKGHEAISKLSRSVVVVAKLKRTSYRGAVNVIYGGEKKEAQNQAVQGSTKASNKRKAGDAELDNESTVKPMSKSQQKRQRKAEAQAQAGHEDKKEKT